MHNSVMIITHRKHRMNKLLHTGITDPHLSMNISVTNGRLNWEEILIILQKMDSVPLL